MSTNIELELRAKIDSNEIELVERYLDQNGKLISDTKRLSVMYFGKINGIETDLRVRITNGEAEIVVKRGDFHSHNRTETATPIDKNQFIDMVKLFTQFDFDDVRIGERETRNYELENGIIASLVTAGNIKYLELEKLSDKASELENHKILEMVASKMGAKIITEIEDFDDLCQLLNKQDDWKFKGSKEDYQKLELKLEGY